MIAREVLSNDLEEKIILWLSHMKLHSLNHDDESHQCRAMFIALLSKFLLNNPPIMSYTMPSSGITLFKHLLKFADIRQLIVDKDELFQALINTEMHYQNGNLADLVDSYLNYYHGKKHNLEMLLAKIGNNSPNTKCDRSEEILLLKIIRYYIKYNLSNMPYLFDRLSDEYVNLAVSAILDDGKAGIEYINKYPDLTIKISEDNLVKYMNYADFKQVKPMIENHPFLIQHWLTIRGNIYKIITPEWLSILEKNISYLNSLNDSWVSNNISHVEKYILHETTVRLLVLDKCGKELLMKSSNFRRLFIPMFNRSPGAACLSKVTNDTVLVSMLLKEGYSEHEPTARSKIIVGENQGFFAKLLPPSSDVNDNNIIISDEGIVTVIKPTLQSKQKMK